VRPRSVLLSIRLQPMHRDIAHTILA
jgi:hypothetical protein